MKLFKRLRSKENEIDPDVQIVKNQREDDRQDAEQHLVELKEKEEHGEEEEESESYSEDELQEMSMPRLWQIASSLGISKKGKKTKLIDRILKVHKRQEEPEETFMFETLEQLARTRDRLKEFEKTKEGIRTQIGSISKLVPKLKETKELLEKDIHDKQGKIVEITELIPKIEEKKKELQEDIKRKKEEKELLEKDIHDKQGKIVEITELIPKLDRNRKRILNNIELEQKKISKIEEQIKQILEMRRYDIRLVSTLVYATEMLSGRKQ